MIYPRQIVYSLQALGYLASQPENTCVKVRELATELGIPRHFLGKILTELAKKRLVSSNKGPKGGFYLSVKPSGITIYRLLASLGGLEKLEERCVMGFGNCTKGTPCALHELWESFKENAVSKTQKLTLNDFSRSFAGKLQLFKSPMFMMKEEIEESPASRRY